MGSTNQPGVEAVGAAAADGDLGPFLLADPDVALHPVALALGHQWADLGGRVEGVADLHGPHLLDQGLGHLGVAVTGGQDPGQGDAGLAVVHDGVGQHQRHGLGQVDVVEEDGGRLAAQLEAEALEVGPAGGADLSPAAVEPVKETLSTPGMVDQVLAHLTAGRHHAEHALGQPGLGEDLGQARWRRAASRAPA